MPTTRTESEGVQARPSFGGRPRTDPVGKSATPARPTGSPRPARRPPIPLLVGLAAFLLGVVMTLAMPSKYTASTNLVVVPGTATAAQAASLFDTLSRGQIVATASEIYSEPHWAPQSVTLSAGGVTPSAVMTVTATGSNKATVSRSLADVVTKATPTVNRAIAPYQMMRLSPSTLPEAKSTGISKATMLLVSVIFGLVMAALAGILLRMLSQRRSIA